MNPLDCQANEGRACACLIHISHSVDPLGRPWICVCLLADQLSGLGVCGCRHAMKWVQRDQEVLDLLFYLPQLLNLPRGSGSTREAPPRSSFPSTLCAFTAMTLRPPMAPEVAEPW